MDQSPVTPGDGTGTPPPADGFTTLAVLPSDLAESHLDGPFVPVLRTSESFVRWLRDPLPGAEALQVEGLLGDPDPWLVAAQGAVPIPIDVVLGDPAAEFSALYRLVDVRAGRDVRVTIVARRGLFKAVRLAVSLQLPVRLLPGQPDPETLEELSQALEFYLRDPLVESPIEFFHSALAVFRGHGQGTLWSFLEQDPASVSIRDTAGRPVMEPDHVEKEFQRLCASGAECVDCPWGVVCRGYFKRPDPAYDCAGVKRLLAVLSDAAAEIERDLAPQDSAPSHD